MNKFILVFLAFSLCFAGCRRDIIEQTNSTELYNPTIIKVEASVTGRVVNENGEGVVGATVYFEGFERTTGVEGFFSFHNVLMNKDAAFVRVSAPNCFSASKQFTTRLADANYVTLQLMKKENVQTINSEIGGVVALNDGAKVVLPANGFVKEDGSTYLGDVLVAGRWLNTTEKSTFELMPGNTRVISLENKLMASSSYGMIVVELASSDGQKLNIGNDAEATLEFPIPGILSNGPNSLSMSYMDEKNGFWREEAVSAQKVDGKYVAKVKHFTFWNCSIISEGAWIEGVLLSANSTPLSNAFVTLVNATDTSLVTCGTTNADGSFSAFVPVNAPHILSCYALFSCSNPVYQSTIAPINADVNLGSITFGTDAAFTQLQGEFVDCEFNSIANTIMFIYNSDGAFSFIETNQNGQFATPVTYCGEGAETTVTLISPIGDFTTLSNVVVNGQAVLDLGVVQMTDCVPTPDEYLIASAYSNNFNFTENLKATQVADTTNFSLINGIDSLLINFPGTAVGFYSLQDNGSFGGRLSLGVDSYITFSCSDCSDVWVDIYEYGAVGESIKGTFSGTMDNVKLYQNGIPITLPNELVTGSFSVFRE